MNLITPRQGIALNCILDYIMDHEREDFEANVEENQDDEELIYHHVYFEALVLSHGMQKAAKIVKDEIRKAKLKK